LRDRVVVAAGLVALSAWAWAWLLTRPAMPATGSEMLMPHPSAWSLGDAAAMFLMWAIMMVGMMVPSATPMVLLYTRVARRGLNAGQAHLRTGLFVGGYIAAWSAFSALATGAQWGLEHLALLTPMMKAASPLLGGALLIAAGAYQFMPAKHACLERCRTPFMFVTQRWRAGGRGAFVMGLDHGFYCLGCCWLLMALLFVVGVMNLFWVALIAGIVMAEKIFPAGHALARLFGAGLVAAGGYVLLTAA
jgi:predicted metal-binding membrane protein